MIKINKHNTPLEFRIILFDKLRVTPLEFKIDN